MIEIPLKVYPYTVHFCFNIKYKKYKKYIKKLGHTCNIDKEYFNRVYGLTDYYGSHIIIYLEDKPVSPKEYSVIAHEALHAVTFVMTEIGMILSKETAEAYCYLLDFILDEIYNSLELKP